MTREQKKQLTEELVRVTGGRLLLDTMKGELEEAVRRISAVFAGVRYRYTFDVIDGLLLFAMGRHVRERQHAGLTFTAANQVHVPNLVASLAVRCRTTQCSKLGIVAKCVLRKEDVPPGSGREAGSQVPGVWVVTDRGFAALRGEKCVPSWVGVKGGSLEERSGKLVGLADAFRAHQAAVEAAVKRGRAPRSDYRAQIAGYNPEEWYEITGRVPTWRVAEPARLL